MMKKRLALVAVVAFLFGVIIHLTAQTTAAQSGPNLLTNPGFEDGHYNQNNIAEITVPNGWRMHWLDGVEFMGSNGVAHRPETVVWNVSGAPPEEADLFWKDGIYTLKIFKGWAPMYAALSQDVTGLEVGRRYRLSVPIYIDIIAEYDDGKVAPSKLDSGRVRLGAGPTGAAWRSGEINYSGWWTAETVSPFYQAYPVFVHDFTATQENMTVWIEVASIDPYPNNGFFTDLPSLRALDEVDTSVGSSADGDGQSAPAQPANTSTPFPTPTPRPDGAVIHKVQSGDTFWSIAIRYASTLGVTPEEALPLIQERNDNPAFINVGDELIILPPQDEAVAADGAGTEMEAETTTVDDAATSEETAEETADTEATAETESTETPAPEPTVTETTAANAVCVTTYEDVNGDGNRQKDSEPPLADAALTLANDQGTVATYVSDGLEEEYCFDGLENGTYMIQFFPPANYSATATNSWAVAVSNGSNVSVDFGAQEGVAVADANTEAAAATGEETSSSSEETAATSETAASTAQETTEPGSLMSNLGTIIIGIAIFLIIIASVGVVLLRRS